MQRRQYKLCGISKGFISSYMPVIFTNSYSSFLEIGVHSIIMDYKFRDLPLSEQCPLSLSEPVVTIVNTKHKKQERNPNKPKDLLQCLLSDGKEVASKIKMEKADEVYNKHVLPLKKVLKQLKDSLTDFFQRIVSSTVIWQVKQIECEKQ